MLPIGSIVQLKNEKNKFMILNRGPEITKDGKTTMYDYYGCLYPYGLDRKDVYYFNDKDIEDVIFQEYKDEEEIGFQKFYINWLKKNNSRAEKEKIEDPVS